MKRKERLPELLSPAGNMQALIGAVKGGADAVYIGAKSFSARAFAENFDSESIREAVRYCHLHGVKLYVALNTLIYDREIEEAAELAREIYRVGADALIVADLGLISILKEAVPNLELHASTQMSVHNSLGADEAWRLGCKRVVLARETSGRDIAKITESSKPEIEVFLHGALCVCHSGQCLFSSLVGGRSGNRGECAQPCRLPYNDSYPLSLSDLSLAKHIPSLIESGVASLKIEGRMKSSEYVYRVTRIFRHLLDEGRGATDGEMAELRQIFSRGSFTDGYYTGKIEKMTGVRSREEKETTKAVAQSALTHEKVKIKASISIKKNQPARLTFSLGDREAVALGSVPSPAISSPLTEELVRERVAKLGATPLTLDLSDIECDIDEGLNLSPKELNELRRQCAESLIKEDRELDFIPVRKAEKCKDSSPYRIADFYSFDTAERFISNYKSEAEFFDIISVPLFELSKADGFSPSRLGARLPSVIMESEIPAVREALEKVKNMGILYAFVGNIGQIRLALDYGLVPVGDFRFNICNSYSREVIEALGVVRPALSPELTLAMARDIGGGTVVYGRIPLMITERCFVKELAGCKACSDFSLCDRLGVKFPVIREWSHRALVLNSRITYMADKKNELSSHNISKHRFIFTKESAEEVRDTVIAYKKGTPFGDARQIRRVGRSDMPSGKISRQRTKEFSKKY